MVRVGFPLTNLKSFINPPFIRNIIIQNDNKLYANNIIKDQSVFRLLKASEIGISNDFSNIRQGSSLVSKSKGTDYICIFFDAPSSTSSLSNYKVRIGLNKNTYDKDGFALKTLKKFI